MIRSVKPIVAAMLVAIPAVVASAQDAAVPCKDAPCVMLIDWGSGKTSASYPPDRRYGSGDDFDSKFRSAMTAHGYRVRDTPLDGAMTITVRPTMKPRSMCDPMAGTNTEMNCTAMTTLAVTFLAADPKAKAPGAIRITNRCGANNTFMDHKVFAQYAADMIWWQLEGQAAKADRPVVNC